MVRGTSERALFPYKLTNGSLLGSSGLKSFVVYLSIPLRHELVLTLGGGEDPLQLSLEHLCFSGLTDLRTSSWQTRPEKDLSVGFLSSSMEV